MELRIFFVSFYIFIFLPHIFMTFVEFRLPKILVNVNYIERYINHKMQYTKWCYDAVFMLSARFYMRSFFFFLCKHTYWKTTLWIIYVKYVKVKFLMRDKHLSNHKEWQTKRFIFSLSESRIHIYILKNPKHLLNSADSIEFWTHFIFFFPYFLTFCSLAIEMEFLVDTIF